MSTPLPFPTALMPLPGAVAGRVRARYTGQWLAPQPGGLGDLRHQRPNTGTIADQVLLRINASTELPFANGRVWLLRLADGYKAWEGWSNATGHYTATGLELGVEYVAVAIDPLRNHKTTGAGPVTALQATP